MRSLHKEILRAVVKDKFFNKVNDKGIRASDMINGEVRKMARIILRRMKKEYGINETNIKISYIIKKGGD